MDSAIIRENEKEAIRGELTRMKFQISAFETLLNDKVSTLPEMRTKLYVMLERVHDIMWRLPD